MKRIIEFICAIVFFLVMITIILVVIFILDAKSFETIDLTEVFEIGTVWKSRDDYNINVESQLAEYCINDMAALQFIPGLVGTMNIDNQIINIVISPMNSQHNNSGIIVQFFYGDKLTDHGDADSFLYGDAEILDDNTCKITVIDDGANTNNTIFKDGQVLYLYPTK